MKRKCPEGFSHLWMAVDAVMPTADAQADRVTFIVRMAKCREHTVNALREYAKVLSGDAKQRCLASIEHLSGKTRFYRPQGLTGR